MTRTEYLFNSLGCRLGTPSVYDKYLGVKSVIRGVVVFKRYGESVEPVLETIMKRENCKHYGRACIYNWNVDEIATTSWQYDFVRLMINTRQQYEFEFHVSRGINLNVFSFDRNLSNVKKRKSS